MHRHARPELINRVIAYYRAHGIDGMVREPSATIGADLEGDLQRHFGIEYRAPQDAAAMDGLADGSIDFVVSTNTLEHIPRNAIVRIMQECHRLCHEDSVLSMKIDYSDHYARVDPAISHYNFLSYGEREWRRYNAPMHYQNRLRHRDYREIFEASGFEVAEEELLRAEDAIELVKRMPIAPEFAAYSPEELATHAGRFVLRRARARSPQERGEERDGEREQRPGAISGRGARRGRG